MSTLIAGPFISSMLLTQIEALSQHVRGKHWGRLVCSLRRGFPSHSAIPDMKDVGLYLDPSNRIHFGDQKCDFFFLSIAEAPAIRTVA